MQNRGLSIVIPCYNEENNLKRGVLEEVYLFLKSCSFDWEVLLCNDESTDNSLKILAEFAKTHKNFHCLDLPHGGKPSAVWGGIQKAQYPLVLFTDMDQSTPLSEVNKLLPFFDQGFDVVIGSRGIQRQGNSLLRRVGGPVFLFLRRLAILPNIIDTQCGFKAFRTEVARELFPNLQFFRDNTDNTGWRVSAFDVELLFMAQKWGYKIKEIVVKWKNEDTSSTKGNADSRYKKESLQMIQEIIRVIRNDFKGFYRQSRPAIPKSKKVALRS